MLRWSVVLALSACVAQDGEMTQACETELGVVDTLPTGHHNEGLGCITSGCHDGGTPAAPRWTVAGTLYRGDGAATLSGGTIQLVDASGTEVTLVSAQNGNFWTSQAVMFPLTAKATACTESRSMPTPVPTGSCNQGGCHNTRRIDLP
jgi:hypothetical protein